ncbi:MAG: hypothetical protein Q8Q91_00075 [Candidatus Daviesbacteria bacterium]|nr:hypothetical protein [Candidatus Daviesbacteria bacterium]
MKNIIKIVIVSLFALASFFIFNALEFDLLLLGFSKYIQSAIFAGAGAVLILRPCFAFWVAVASMVLLAGTVFFYMFNLMALANYLASLAIGLLTIAAVFNLKDPIGSGHD